MITIIIVQVIAFGIMIWMVIGRLSDPSLATTLSKRENYRIITDGTKFGYESRYLQKFWKFWEFKWEDGSAHLYHETKEEAEKSIQHRIEDYKKDLLGRDNIKIVK